MKEKKIWVMPELIVLVRSKPEEEVLAMCKSGGPLGPGAGPSTNNNNCTIPGCGANCSAQSVS